MRRSAAARGNVSDAFPSCPTRPPKHVVTFRKTYALTIHNFVDINATRAFIEAVIKDDDFKWDNPNCIRVPILDLTISSATLEDIMESTGEFELPDPYPLFASQVRGSAFAHRLLPNNGRPEDTGDEEEAPKAHRRARKEDAEPRPKREPKPSTDGMTTIAQIADQLKLDPSKARALLRKAQIEKPDHGWAWADPAPIIAKLKGAQ